MNESKTVQWFPGHMAKTRRLIKESLTLVDAVCELVDARLPLSSRNPEIDALVGRKPRIVLLNKCDLADDAATARVIAAWKAQGVTALPVDCRSGRGLEKFLPAVRALLADKLRAYAEKGMAGKALRLMVVGIPNTGKSSFINRMAGRSRAKVADKPGVTRSNQWFAIDRDILLLDTPGVLWPKFEDPEVGYKLAFIGSVKDEILDSQEIAVRLLAVLQKNYPERLAQRYGLTGFENMETYELLEAIAQKRGMLLKKGEFDTERAAVMLLDEYRGGKLGKLTLDAV